VNARADLGIQDSGDVPGTGQVSGGDGRADDLGGDPDRPVRRSVRADPPHPRCRVRVRRGGIPRVVAGALLAAEFWGGPGAGLRVSGPGRAGEHELKVDIGAAGHRRVQPVPVFGAGDQRDPGVHGGALGGVPDDRVGEVRCLLSGVAAGLAGGRVGVERSADHDAVAGGGLDPQNVPVG
jgi:hypothetical protein